MSDTLISILLIIVGLGAGFGISVLVSYLRLKNAGKKIAELLKKAEIDAEKLKRDFILSAKEESYKHKQEVEREIKERKSELKESEERLIQREKNMDKRDETFQKRESLLDEREAKLQEKVASIQNDQAELERLKEEEMKLLTKISNMDPEKAKELIFARVEEKLQTELSLYIKEREEEARQSANVKAKDMLVSAMQKYASDVVNEQTVSTIALPNNEMKGRIIGREGRNIRTIEAITGVDLIIDDTPEAIVVSSFDPLRREIAKVTIESLIKDGRIHPTRIEELYDKTVREIREQIFEYGNSALFELGIAKMDHELIELVGKLHFRTSYGQNALTHSLEVAHLAGVMAAELGENSQLAKRAGLLHDIGKAIDHEVEGSHVEIGVDLAKKFHESKTVINAIHSHHGDVEATSIISILVQIADSLSASRPGARNDSVESYIKRLEQLEHMTHGIAGVEKSYAIQAGRELRVLVKPEEVDDLKAHQIAREVKEKIESEMQYPGTIKVTVVREVRAQEEAK